MFGGLFGKSRSKGSQEDPEFEQKNNHLNLFLQAQELLISLGQGKPQFSDEREKLRYVHFVFGAVDQLSRTIKNDERAEQWCVVTSTVRAGMVLGMDDAFSEIERYGHSDDAELMDAGKRGFFAMQNYILNALGKCSPEEFRKSCTELFAVVRAEV